MQAAASQPRVAADVSSGAAIVFGAVRAGCALSTEQAPIAIIAVVTTAPQMTRERPAAGLVGASPQNLEDFDAIRPCALVM